MAAGTKERVGERLSLGLEAWKASAGGSVDQVDRWRVARRGAEKRGDKRTDGLGY